MFCAELMSNMKDVPSTERMVMCSQRWKLLKQGEKDAYQKRCEQVRSSAAKPGRKDGLTPSPPKHLNLLSVVFIRGRRNMK